jgi:ferritin-like metal-binding protein YciE
MFMASVTLRDLYVAELHDLMNAEKQLLNELPVMAARATSARLQHALDEHHAETKVHLERVRLLIQQLNEPARAIPSSAMAALIEDARRRFRETERGDILDAALIAAAQRIEHYEMASYGTVRSYAESLGDYEAAQILQQTLDEEGHTDHTLTKLAERGINRAASEDLVEDATRYRSRLRYIAAKDLPGAREEGDLHLHNHEGGEHLGVLDGFIVESQSGRPLYYVIDSRGWFAGRRYVVPVGQIEPYEGATALHTTLTRKELARYPEFSPSAFTAMDDSDALRYERRLHRAFAPDTKPYDGRPVYENLPLYRTPAWLKTGVWMSEASGYAVTTQRSDSDVIAVRPVPPPTPATGAYERTAAPSLGSELVMARGEPEGSSPSTSPGAGEETDGHVPDSGDINPRATEQPKTTDPRIERYQDR